MNELDVEIILWRNAWRHRLFVSLGVVSLATTFLLSTQSGCRCRLGRSESQSFATSISFSEHRAEIGSETELVLNVGERVEKIALSSDQKRMFFEARVGSLSRDGLTRDNIEQFFLPLRVELWNVEFADARPEIFTNEKKCLFEVNSDAVAFDDEGDRIFWIEQETNGRLLAQSLPSNPHNLIVRGANSDDLGRPIYHEELYNPESKSTSFPPLPLYLSWNNRETSSAHGRETNVTSMKNQLSIDRSFSAPNDNIADQNLEFVLPDSINPNVINQEPEYISSSQSDSFRSETNEFTHSDKVLGVSNESLATSPDAGGKAEPIEGNNTAEVPDSDSPSNTGVAFVDTPKYTEVEELEFLENVEFNVVMTKPLESEGFILMNSDMVNAANAEVKHMKTALETKIAENVWISSNSKWLVCKTSNDLGSCDAEFKHAKSDKPTTEECDANTEVTSSIKEDETQQEAKSEKKPLEIESWSHDWALIPVRDRKRVIRFPETIRMTFDYAPSNEIINGRVVDILAVCDAEDLVATLVMEQTEDASQEPRSKIIIWDLKVARTVELDKALTPLRAIEVSQIAIPYPVDRKYCKFSPSGKSFAARIDPKYVSVWQSVNGRPVVELGEHGGIVQDFEFSPSELRMAVGVGGTLAQIVVWEIRKGVPTLGLDKFPLDVKAIDSVAFAKDEQFIYFANDIGEIRRWNIRPNNNSLD